MHYVRKVAVDRPAGDSTPGWLSQALAFRTEFSGAFSQIRSSFATLSSRRWHEPTPPSFAWIFTVVAAASAFTVAWSPAITDPARSAYRPPSSIRWYEPTQPSQAWLTTAIPAPTFQAAWTPAFAEAAQSFVTPPGKRWFEPAQPAGGDAWRTVAVTPGIRTFLAAQPPRQAFRTPPGKLWFTPSPHLPGWLVTGTPAPLSQPDRYATYNLDALPDFYAGRLLNSSDLSIVRELADPLWNATPDQTVTLELDNTDGALTAWYLADPTGRSVALKRYDARSGFLATKFQGLITWVRLLEHRVQVDVAVLDRALFTEQVPAPVVTTATFPNAVDVGKTIPVVLGHEVTMPCPNVSDDKVNSLFDYLVGHGTLAVTALARNNTASDSLYSIQFSECLRSDGLAATSWAEVARTDLYPGYTAIRFILRQQDFNNGLHTIYANVTGPAATRNFARAIGTFLSDTTWGLRQTVNQASIDTAAAVLDALPVPLYCDGAMLAPKAAQDWLSDLLLPRGMWLDRNSSGELTLHVDQPRTTVAMAISADPGDGPRNLVAFRERSGPAPEERVRTLYLKYRLDHVRDEFIGQAARSVNAEGKARTIEHAFLRDAGSADLVVDYLGKRIAVGQETAEGVVITQEGRALGIGDLVYLTKASAGYTGNILEVWKIAESLTSLELTLRGWSYATFAYTPGTLPGDPIAGTESDFSRTDPSAATGLSISSSGTTIDPQGKVSAWVILAHTNPTTNFAFSDVLYRLNGATQYSLAAKSITAGATTARIEGLPPGTSVDYAIRVSNAFARTSGLVTLTAQTTPTDATVPSAITATTVTQSGAKVAEITFTYTPPADWAFVRLYRATSNSFAAATEIAKGKQLTFHDETVSYAATYYYWGKVEDLSGNLSGVSPSSGHSLTIAQIVTADVGTGQITTPTIAANAITNAQYVVDVAGGATRDATQAMVDLANGSVSITTTGGPVLVLFAGHWETLNTSVNVVSAGVYLELQRDGSTIQYAYDLRTHAPDTALNQGNIGRITLPITVVDLPSAAAHTYKVRWRTVSDEGTTDQTATTTGHSLECVEMKR